MHSAHREALVSSLLLSPRLQELWDVRDRGTPVFVHSLDVALLCLDTLDRSQDLDGDAVLLGALIHDYNKLVVARDGGPSHSLIMRTEPEMAAAQSLEVLSDAERRSGVVLERSLRRSIEHIVTSHHGKYGKVQPATAEAWLVAECDQLSATEHRLAPIDANDVLPLLSEGYRWAEAAALLGVSREVVKTRLREACDEEGVREWVHLLPVWRARGTVRGGTARRQRQIARARYVSRLARDVPDCVLDRLIGRVRISAPAHV